MVPAGFNVAVVAKVSGARELVALPNGDVLVGTSGSTVVRIPQADAVSNPGSPGVYAQLSDDDAAGIALGPDGALYAGTEHAIWRITGVAGASTASAIARIASVRTGPIAPNSDGDVHRTTSVAVSGATLYAGIGSSCNACTEVDPTRASVQQLPLAGGALATKATKLRNPIALAVDPSNGAVWAGGAGQDTLPFGHPYETLDAVTAHAGVADYGWPNCYDNRVPVSGSAAACASMTVPALVFPAYSTLIGAAFYPATTNGTYAFPAAYRGGLFVTMHGSWHTVAGGQSAAQPLVAFVPFAAGLPNRPVNWSDPTAQWQPFVSNFGTTAKSRIGRPTGVAVGALGSVFVADDLTGNIYRIRPANAAPAARARR